jgi:acyl-CoA thioesterase-1
MLPIALLAILTCVLFPFTGSVEADEKPDEPVVTIVTLGDSITKGVRAGVKPEETFASLLEAGLKKNGVRAEVVNAGIGGERTDGALARLEKDVIARKPKVVTIMYGTNDSFVDKGRKEARLTVEEYRTNLTAIVTKLKAVGVRPVLMTGPRWGPDGRNGLDENPNRLLEKYVEACRSVAKDEKVPLIDHFAIWTKAEAAGTKIAEWTTDQCHPNPAGHQKMAEAMLPIIKQVVLGE